MQVIEHCFENLATEGVQVTEWIARPYQLVSFLEMLRIKGQLLVKISALISGFADITNPDPPPDELMPTKSKRLVGIHLRRVKIVCEHIGFDFSAKCVDGVVKKLKKSYTELEFRQSMRELHQRLQDEASVALLMQIPKAKAEYYEKVNLFGDEAADKFPSAIFDIEEAGKCFALGRSTACVMHLMRVMEVGLRVSATALGLPDPSHANWQNIIDKINKEINQKTAAKDPDWLKLEPFYSQVSAHLFSVKTAWRNPVMHVHSTYDEERALDIFNAVKGFMRHLATELKE